MVSIILLHYVIDKSFFWGVFASFFFKKQPYIPSRKAVYVVCGGEKVNFQPGFEPGSQKALRIDKGSSITYCNKMADTTLNCLTY